MAGIVLKREPVEEPVLLAATAQPKLEFGIDDDTNSEQSDDGPVLMSVKQERLEQDEEMEHANEVCLCVHFRTYVPTYLPTYFPVIHSCRRMELLLLPNILRNVESGHHVFVES